MLQQPRSKAEDMEARKARAEVMADTYAKKFSQPLISAADLADALRNSREGGGKVVLVDVRSPEERAVSVMEDAIHGERGLEALSDAELTAAALIVPYCTIGYRSGRVAERLVRERGLASERVRNGAGVVLFSHHPDLVFIDPLSGARTRKLHVFGREWDIASLDYTTETFDTWWSYVKQGLGVLLGMSG